MAACARPRPAGLLRRGRAVAVCLVALACLRGLRAGRRAGPAAESGTRTVTCTRTATAPRSCTDRASAAAGAPLVVVLHGARGTAADMRANLGWDALADREGLVVAYPDGLDRTWNAGRCCGSRA